MLPDIIVRARVERLLVSISRLIIMVLQVVQLLSIPKLVSGIWEKQLGSCCYNCPRVVVESLVNDMCFDATAFNTGRRSRACGVSDLARICCIWHVDIMCKKLWSEMCSNTALVHHRGLTLAYSAF